ncbi:MAG: hypothetical protein HXL68_03815 [Dechloromonas agitata]|uniref:Uncharacterized protein n=1 Tax=Dechloromonas agitata TaxID=73030 RepID=A0A930BQZ9_9RHOO|nr:hypothetical protein [Dechloromonas agitata]
MVRSGFGLAPTHEVGILNYFDLCLTLVVIPALSEEAEELFTETLMQHFVTDPRQHHALVDARALRVAIEKVEATLGFGMN